MFDIKKVEDEARAEFAADKSADAKKKIKAKLRQIDDAQRIVQNLRDEYAVLLRDICV